MFQIKGQMTNKDEWETVGQDYTRPWNPGGSTGGMERTWLQARPGSEWFLQVMTGSSYLNYLFTHPLW